jgi:hypothetical protein
MKEVCGARVRCGMQWGSTGPLVGVPDVQGRRRGHSRDGSGAGHGKTASGWIGTDAVISAGFETGQLVNGVVRKGRAGAGRSR